MDALNHFVSPITNRDTAQHFIGSPAAPTRRPGVALWVCVLTAVLGFLRLCAADYLIPVEGLVDALPDPRRTLIYLSSSTQGKVLQYDWAAGRFLTPFEIGGKPGALELSSDGNLLLVADMIQQGSDEVLHTIDLSSGIDTPFRFPKGPENGRGLAGVSEVSRGVAAVFSLAVNPLPAARFVSLGDGSSIPWNEPGPISAMAASGNRQFFGLWTSTGFRIYDAVAGSLSAGKRDASEPNTLAVDALGSRFAVVGEGVFVYGPDSRLLARYDTPRFAVALSTVFHPTRPLLFISYQFTNVIEVLDIRSKTLAASINFAGPQPRPTSAPRARMRISPDGSRLFVPVPDGVRVIDFNSPPFSLTGATRYGGTNRVTLAFSSPVAPSTVSNLTQYILEPSGTVLSASYSSNSPSVVTLQVQGTPERVRVAGVEGSLGGLLSIESVATISADPWMPSDAGLWVEGFQDGFNRTEMNSDWVSYTQATGLGGLPVWRQTNGMLQVNPPSRTLNFPNYLLLQRPGYDADRQEVLARVRWRGSTSRVLMGLCASVKSTSPIVSTVREGVSWRNAINNVGFVASKSLVGPLDTKILSTNQWYWLRLRHDRSASPGAPDVFGKVWRADGTEPEPELWNNWDYFPSLTNEEFHGYAGISGTLRNTLGDAFEVDYILIRAAGLPLIRVAPDGPAPRIESISPAQSQPAGSELRLEVLASGDPPLRYQWRREGAPIAGMTASSAQWSAISNAQSGFYDVVIANDRGSITSAPVQIEVVGTPVYSNTFDTVPGPEWAEPRKIITSTGIGWRYLGRLRGRVNFSVGNLAPGSTALVTLKLIAYSNWQGDSPDPNATGNWRVQQDGKDVYATSISLFGEVQSGVTVLSDFRYSFQNYPDVPGGRVFPPLFGNIVQVPSAGTTVREAAFPVRLIATIPASGKLDLEFLNDLGVQRSDTLSINQSWGIDDIAIASVPPETSILRFTQRAVSASEKQSIATLTVERLGALQSHVSTRLNFENQTASRGIDFDVDDLVLDFPAGVERVNVPVRILDNARADGTRYASARLVGSSVGAVIGDTQQTLLAIDDDETWLEVGAPGGLAFEGQTYAEVPLNAYGDRSMPQRVRVLTQDGTARAGFDYVGQTNQLILAPGVSQATASIQLRDDALDEGDESFFVHARGDSTAQRSVRETFEVWILDDDSQDSAGRGTVGSISSLTRLNDESILVGGTFTTFNGRNISAPVRLRSDGSLDPTYPPQGAFWHGGFAPIQTTQGQWILPMRLEGFANIVKVDPDLVTPAPFALTNAIGVSVVAEDSLGRLYLGGMTFFLNGATYTGIVRLMSDGSFDPAFSVPSMVQGTFVQAILPLPDGKLLLGGALSWSSGTAFTMLSRLKEDGTRDEGFESPELVNPIRKMIPVEGGDVVVMEDTAVKLVSSDGAVRRILPSLDASLGVVSDVYRQRDGRLLIVDTKANQPISQTRFYRLDTNYEIDPTFQHHFNASAQIKSIVETKDNHLIVGGLFDEYDHRARHNLVRLHLDGTDAGWPGEGPLPTITGKIQVPVTSIGDPFELTVPAENATEFLWLHNGVPISGQTGATLRIASTTELDAGEYVALARTAHLARWSEPVELVFQVRPPSLVLEAPRVDVDGSFRFEFQTEKGSRYRVETSTDLDRWELLQNLDGTGSRLTIGFQSNDSGHFVRAVREL